MKKEDEFRRDSESYRFNSLELSMKDGDENDLVVANAIVTDQRKE